MAVLRALNVWRRVLLGNGFHAALRFALVAFLLALSATSVAYADASVQGRRAASAIPQHTITCSAEADQFTKTSSNSLTFSSGTQCTDWVQHLGITTTLQQRSGIWPFYSWNNVGNCTSDSYGIDHVEVGCSAVLVGSGTYRIDGHHVVDSQPDHPPQHQEFDSYSGEFSMP